MAGFAGVHPIQKTINTVEDINTSGCDAVVVRLLNSPLRGCEFTLQPGKTLFLVGPEAALIADGLPPVLPADTLFVPLAEGGVNFEVLLEDGASRLRILGEPVVECDAPFNQALTIGALRLAMRPQHLPWQPEVLSGFDIQPAEPPAPSAERPMARARYGAFGFAALLAIALLSAGMHWLWNSPQRQMAELSALLGDNGKRFQVMTGRDGVYYIAAADARDGVWARQSLLRGDFSEPVQVLEPVSEGARVSRWLADSRPELAFYRLLLDDPRQPQLWVSMQRSPLSDAEKQKLASQLGELMPYSDKVSIVPVDDELAAKQAEEGLSRQALPFTRNDQRDSVTFVIAGALDDGELQRARQFVDGYYRQWGARYVQFAVELKDDLLKGHSFQYGRQGYVKLSNGHWFFPQPI
ncbi:type III secretion system protein PrgH [Chromobacterium phragmitis]|uniref:PrgH/EprH family type III secretion apparatus protein n=1 Tax=Chromobacterium phragmitis TaxID=2202141 RepID=UPI000DEC2AC8|nr:PrgH/EprH family type III secretion apparatus protein [Chromobacterium phragmitis]AXE31876.1 type III secretion system protein PrgH [Chromobacterium phragmitis]